MCNDIVNSQKLYDDLVKIKYEDDLNEFKKFLKEECPLLLGILPSKKEFTTRSTINISRNVRDARRYLQDKKIVLAFSYGSPFLDIENENGKITSIKLQHQYVSFLHESGWKVICPDKKESTNEFMDEPNIIITLVPIENIPE